MLVEPKDVGRFRTRRTIIVLSKNKQIADKISEQICYLSRQEVLAVRTTRNFPVEFEDMGAIEEDGQP